MDNPVELVKLLEHEDDERVVVEVDDGVVLVVVELEAEEEVELDVELELVVVVLEVVLDEVELTGRVLLVEVVELAGAVDELVVDPPKLDDELDEEPDVVLEEGVRA